jgi:AraC family transcriptional regulator
MEPAPRRKRECLAEGSEPMIATNFEASTVRAYSLAGDELRSIVTRLLSDAGDTLGTDLFAAKTLIDQAAALLEKRQETEWSPVRVDPMRSQALAPWQIRGVVTYVTLNLDSPIRNADLAAVARLSVGYFIRAFKDSFALTPRAYVMQRRIQRAKELMRSTDETLTQIAYICGFADQPHFSTVFKRESGTSPTQWRRARDERAATLSNEGMGRRTEVARMSALRA